MGATRSSALALALVAAGILASQGCQRSSYYRANPSGSQDPVGSGVQLAYGGGSGDPFEGQIARYVHLDPSVACADGLPEAEVDVAGSGASRSAELVRSGCAPLSPPRPLSMTELSFATDGSGDLTYQGSLFTPVPHASGTWTAIGRANAPSARIPETALWTGSRMIVWGGWSGTSVLNDGALYYPVSATWTPISSVGAPAARALSSVVWTGSRMLVWGGMIKSNDLHDGGIYDPQANAWSAMSPVGVPGARDSAAAVWTGSKMIVWGGSSNVALQDGGVYDPQADRWSGVTAIGAPSGRQGGAAVWTGTRMLVWGGFAGGTTTVFGDGASYDPSSNSWSPMSAAGSPSPRRFPSVAWTGSKMIVWGGSNGDDTSFYNDGRIYDPSADSWKAMSAVGAPSARAHATAAWTGSKMIVWGGYGGGYLNDGAIYDPATDTWSSIALSGAPSGRADSAAVWTGSGLLIWGGGSGSGAPTFGVSPTFATVGDGGFLSGL